MNIQRLVFRLRDVVPPGDRVNLQVRFLTVDPACTTLINRVDAIVLDNGIAWVEHKGKLYGYVLGQGDRVEPLEEGHEAEVPTSTPRSHSGSRGSPRTATPAKAS